MEEDEDKTLLNIYMCGFNDELDNKIEMLSLNSLLLKAYELGRLDALIGDDVKSIDYQTSHQILYRIRH